MRKSLIVATLICASPLGAQSLPPVRPIGQTVARSTDSLGSVSQTVALANGQVLVNDILRRRVLLMDSSLAIKAVVADSSASTANAYGGRSGGLLAYRGDSALFVDPSSMSMLVIDPAGAIKRVMSAPRPQDVNNLIGGPNGSPGFDTRGKLVYRSQPPLRMGAPRGGGSMPVPEFPDSTAVVRFDLASRSLDTAGFFKVAKPNINVTQTPNGGMSITTSVDPIPVVDDWAILSDGTVAFVRGADYHIDWVTPSGERISSPKIPYEWQRLDDDGKAALLDSARQAMEKAREMAMRGQGPGGGPVFIGGGGPAGGAGMEVMVRSRGGDAGPPARGATPAGAQARVEIPPINMVTADKLPDYRPAFTTGSARGDLAGNLWVRTTSPVGNAGPIYFVINTKNEVIDRVQLPEGRLLIGFAKNGDVFMALRDADGNARVERAKMK